jgi:hypothetical protein
MPPSLWRSHNTLFARAKPSEALGIVSSELESDGANLPQARLAGFREFVPDSSYLAQHEAPEDFGVTVKGRLSQSGVMG